MKGLRPIFRFSCFLALIDSLRTRGHTSSSSSNSTMDRFEKCRAFEKSNPRLRLWTPRFRVPLKWIQTYQDSESARQAACKSPSNIYRGNSRRWRTHQSQGFLSASFRRHSCIRVLGYRNIREAPSALRAGLAASRRLGLRLSPSSSPLEILVTSYASGYGIHGWPQKSS